MSRHNFRSTSSLLGVKKVVLKKIGVPGCHAKKHLILKNPGGTPPTKVRPRPRKQCINFFTNRFFSLKFLILSMGLLWRWSPPNIKYLTAYYNSQFCVSFNFCFCQETQKRLYTCLKIIWFSQDERWKKI